MLIRRLLLHAGSANTSPKRQRGDVPSLALRACVRPDVPALALRACVRPAFTLLEVTLASAIGLLIMYGLYLAISVQLKFAEAGRYAVEQATLARSLTARIANDITPSVGMPDPSRFRQSSQSGQSGQSGAGGTTPSSGSTTPSTTTPSSTTPSGTTSTSTTTTTDSNGVPVQALYGDASSLRVYVSRVPPVLGGGSSGGTTGELAIKSDQRVIEYWVTNNGGLARQEIAVVTASADNLPLARGTGNEGQYVIAPEVTGVEFSYFDGTDWQTSWDSTALGSDNMTPLGPPLAVAVLLEITTPATAERAERVQRYRHVVAIPTANGLPQQTDSTGQTNGTSSSSGSSSGPGR
ncbi:MAG: hypothetical protein HYS12_24525 [Planctomycetes bacterium]|nr:hypothetical protein [Planctomycetota bacterium]